MRIFFFENCFDGTVGGSHACMYHLIKGMDRAHFEFTVGFYQENIYVEKFKNLNVDATILTREPIENRNFIYRKFRNWYKLDYELKKYLRNYFRSKQFDLVVINNSIYPNLIFADVCKREKIPLVVYERGVAPYQRRHIKKSPYISAAIPVSDFIKQILLNHGFRTPVIRRIYDGIDPEKFHPNGDKGEIKKAINIPLDSKVIGIIGNLRPWKGQAYFVEAFKELADRYPDLHGLIVGGWGEAETAFRKELSNRIIQSGLENRVHFLGYYENIPEILSILDVFVHASAKPEPFGMVILEAMAAKRPVVASRLGGPIEILNNGECGILVPPKDGSAIAKACAAYLDNPDFKKDMVARAYARLCDAFHIDTTIEEVSKLFVEMQELKGGTGKSGKI